MASTRPGDLVLDPFAGSGSVGVACKELGRSFVGIELIEENVQQARNRIQRTDPPFKEGATSLFSTPKEATPRRKESDAEIDKLQQSEAI